MESALKNEMSPMFGINSLMLNMTGKADRFVRFALPALRFDNQINRQQVLLTKDYTRRTTSLLCDLAAF